MMNHSEFSALLPDEQLDTVNEQIRLIRKKQGLTFGTDAYLLSAFVPASPRERAVDLGSGTGIIPLLLLARGKVSSVTAVEIQPAFADLIRRNAQLNGMEEKIRAVGKDLRDVTQNDTGGEVRIVTANPPYLTRSCGRSNLSFEKEIARHEVFGGIRDFCAAASRLLMTGGKFYCVWRPERLADLFCAMRENRLEPKKIVAVSAVPALPPSIILAEAVKDASPGMKYLPPLFLYREGGDPRHRSFSPAAEQIFATCSFPEEIIHYGNHRKENR